MATSDNPEAAPQKIFSILAVFPSIQLGLIDAASLMISGDGTSVASHVSPFGRHFLPAAAPAFSAMDVHAIIPRLMRNGDGKVITKHGTSTIRFICCAVETTC